MKRVLVPLVVCSALLAVAPFAQASDSSLKSALKSYEANLTKDIGYLATFKAPSKSGASAALHKISKVESDLNAVEHAASGQQASSSSGRTGRSEVLSALHYALVAAGDAKASATAARSHNASTAKKDAKATVSETNKAIPLFESGGKLLKLF